MAIFRERMFGVDFITGALYTINDGTGAATSLASTNINLIGGLSMGPDGKLYGLVTSGFGTTAQLMSYNPASGDVVTVGDTGAYIFEGDMDYNAVDGTFYALSAATRELYNIDPDDGAQSLAGTVPSGVVGDVLGMTFDENGVLWVLASDSTSSALYSLDMATLTISSTVSILLPGPTALDLGSVGGLDYDADEQIFYIADGGPGGTDTLYSVLKPSGSGAQVVKTVGSLTGMTDGTAALELGYYNQISGRKFRDIDRDGLREAFDYGIADWKIFADLNHNYQHDTVTVTVEPDDFSVGAVITNPAFGLTLRAAENDGRTNEITVASDFYASTGNNIFDYNGNGSLEYFAFDQQAYGALRVDSAFQIQSFSVDVTEAGALESSEVRVYDVNNTLITTLNSGTAVNNGSGVFVNTFEYTAASDVAPYAIEIAGSGGNISGIDNLSVTYWEPSAITDELGDYTLDRLPAGTYSLVEEGPHGWEQTGPELRPGFYLLSDNGVGAVNQTGLYYLNADNGFAPEQISTSIGGNGARAALTNTVFQNVLLGGTSSAANGNNLFFHATDGTGPTGGVENTFNYEGLAFDAVANVYYAVRGSNEFFQLDPNTGTTTTLTAPGFFTEGLAYHPNGLVYAIDNLEQLRAYNGATWSVIGATGVNWSDEGLAVDPRTGTLYAVNATTDSIYTIDTTSGAASLVSTFNGQTLNGSFGLAYVAPPSGDDYGTFYFNTEGAGNGSRTLYDVNVFNGASQMIGPNLSNGIDGGAAPSDHWTEIFATRNQNGPLTSVSTLGQSGTQIGTVLDAEGMAYDPTTDLLYGIDGTAQDDFFVYNQTDGTRDVNFTLAPAPFAFDGLAWGNNKIYALDPGTTQLHAYDIATDTWSAIGDTGLLWTDVALAYDQFRDLLYAKRFNDDNVYKIDPTNGSTEAIGTVGLASGGSFSPAGGGAYVANTDRYEAVELVTVGNGDQVIEADFGNMLREYTIAEVGFAAVNHNAFTVNLSNRFIDPVVIARPASQNGTQPVAIRISDVEDDQFTMQLQEPNVYDGLHPFETVSWMVVERGSWRLDDGTLIQAGTLDSALLSTAGFESVSFEHDFTDTPTILTQTQTFNGSDFVVTRQNLASNTGFQVTMQEEEARNGGAHAQETIGFVAVDQGVGQWSGLNYMFGDTGDTVAHNFVPVDLSPGSFTSAPNILASVASFDEADTVVLRTNNITQAGFQIRVQEEVSANPEIGHRTETVDFMAIEGTGLLQGSKVAPVIAQVGTLTASTSVQSLVFEHDFDNPVVFAKTVSYNDPDPVNIRITDVQAGQFSYKLQEPDGADGIHANEQVSFIVVEAGTWRLADGTVLEVGTVDTNQVAVNGFVPINFTNGAFDETPSVLTQVQTNAGTSFVDTRQRDANATGVEIAMEEQESNIGSGHMNETLGYMAIERGTGLWETSTLNAPLRFEAGTTGIVVTDAFTPHEFEQAFFLTPNVIADLSSYNDGDPARLRYDALDQDFISFKADEDTTGDGEQVHGAESVDFLAVTGSGLLLGEEWDTYL